MFVIDQHEIKQILPDNGKWAITLSCEKTITVEIFGAGTKVWVDLPEFECSCDRVCFLTEDVDDDEA